MTTIRTTLDIEGFKGKRIPHVFYRQQIQGNALAILYGGWLPTADSPILYYTRRILLGLGYDVLRVDLGHTNDEQYARLSDRKRQEWFLAEAELIYRAASQGPYFRTVVAAQSVGTLAIAHLLLEGLLPEEANLVWLGPPLDAESLRGTLASCSFPSLVVVGKRAPRYTPELRKELAKNRALDLMVIDQAGEDLEVEEDVLRSIQVAQDYIERLKVFLGAAAPSTKRSSTTRSSTTKRSSSKKGASSTKRSSTTRSASTASPTAKRSSTTKRRPSGREEG